MERLTDYDYHLPESQIAQVPLADRSASRLLVLDRDTGTVRHQAFADLVNLLHPGDLLVMNDTRVTARRLSGKRPTGGHVEALLLKRRTDLLWEALLRPAKRLKVGSEIAFEQSHATVEEDLGDGKRLLRFDSDPSDAGEVPLPPYIGVAIADPERYQTVYASKGGSAAAPTAGLHFTDTLLDALRAKGVAIAHVTLDVGLDTFRPVQSERIAEHEMHGERCSVPEETGRAIEACTGRVIAVGTTTVRTLESMAIGVRRVRAGEMTTKIFIRPGYRFQAVDGMITNFHMPRTSMLMMLSAFAGRENVLRAYVEAIVEGYRFLSFGDSMLILPGLGRIETDSPPGTPSN